MCSYGLCSYCFDATMAERQVTYRKITDKQRETLMKYYNDYGMVSKGARYLKLIEECSKETGLTTEQVKVSYNCLYHFVIV